MATYTDRYSRITNTSDDLVLNIERLIEDEHLEERVAAVCVYRVPKWLSYSKPEAFTPQFMGLGPYHHSRPEVYTNEKLKVVAVKKVLKDLEFRKLVEELINLKPDPIVRVHDYYDSSIGFQDTLLYLMTVDALFLYYLLDSSGTRQQDSKDGAVLTGLTRDAIIRDVFMLENQIPTPVLTEIVRMINSKKSEPHEEVDEYVGSKMLDFCGELCPLLKIKQVSNKSEVVEHVHLLGLMYHLIVPEPQSEHNDQGDRKSPPAQDCSCKWYYISMLPFNICWVMVSLVLLILKLFCWVIRSLLYVLKFLARHCSPVVDAICLFQTDGGVNISGTGESFQESTNSNMGACPVIMIPSVTELHKAWIFIRPAKGGILSIEFNERKRTLYLPSIRLDVNSEVIMRNLVAYESLTKSNCLIFTRYVELMTAIIDTAEDVKLLVDRKIIQTQLSYEQVAQLFNGMNKSMRPTKTPCLEKEINKVNAKFNSSQNPSRFMAKYVYPSWRFFTFVAAVALLALTAMQAFQSVS